MSDNATSIVLAILALLVAISPIACTMHEDAMIADLIKAGISPLDAKCAVASRLSTTCFKDR